MKDVCSCGKKKVPIQVKSYGKRGKTEVLRLMVCPDCHVVEARK